MRKTRVLLSVGGLLLVILLYIMTTSVTNNKSNEVVQEQPIQSTTVVESDTTSQNMNSEGRRVYVAPTSSNLNVQGGPQGVLQMLTASHEAKNKFKIITTIGFACVIFAYIFGKGYLKFYSHKRKSYERMQDEIISIQEMIIKQQALISRCKDPNEKQRYCATLDILNSRHERLLNQITKLDTKFAK